MPATILEFALTGTRPHTCLDKNLSVVSVVACLRFILLGLKDKLVKSLIENQSLTAVKCSHSCYWFGYKMLHEFQWFRRLCLLTRNMLKRQTNKTRNYGNS